MPLAYLDNFYNYTFWGFCFFFSFNYCVLRIEEVFRIPLFDIFDMPFKSFILSCKILGFRMPLEFRGSLVYVYKRKVCFKGRWDKFWYNLLRKDWFSICFEYIIILNFRKNNLLSIKFIYVIITFFLWNKSA